MAESKADLNETEKKRKLLEFIDKKMFDPIINLKSGKYSGEQKKTLEEVREKTKNEQEQFHKLENAKEIKKNYLSNVRSEAAKKVNRKLKELDLPTMPEHKDEFQKLCDELGV